MHLNQIVVALGACVLVSAAPTTSPLEYAAELEKRSSPGIFHTSNETQFLSSCLTEFAASAAEFGELQRAAQLSSAAYSGCLGAAFDVTVTW